MLDLIPDTNGADLLPLATAIMPASSIATSWPERSSRYPFRRCRPERSCLTAYDVNNDSWTDLAASGILLLNHGGKLQPATSGPKGPLVFADLMNRGIGDIVSGAGLYLNQGKGELQKSSVAVPAAAALATSDFDGDGKADVALSTRAANCTCCRTPPRETQTGCGSPSPE